MKVAFEISEEKLKHMIWAIEDLLDYYGCCPSNYPIDLENVKELEEDGTELAAAAYELGSRLKAALKKGA